jgi:hypothetical protein
VGLETADAGRLAVVGLGAFAPEELSREQVSLLRERSCRERLNEP